MNKDELERVIDTMKEESKKLPVFEEITNYMVRAVFSKEYIEKAKQLIQQFGIAYFETFTRKGGLLGSAAYYQHISILDLLLELGSDINQTDEKGDTALSYAFSREDNIFEVVRYLVEKGIDVNCSSSEKTRPLMETLRHNWYREGELFYQYGADINIKYEKVNEYGVIVQLRYLEKKEREKWIHLFLRDPRRCENELLKKLKEMRLKSLV